MQFENMEDVKAFREFVEEEFREKKAEEQNKAEEENKE
jgi:hypothetical protein